MYKIYRNCKYLSYKKIAILTLMHALKKPYLILLAIVLALIVLISCTYNNYGKTWDENDTVSLGNHALTYYTSLGKNTSYFSFYPQKEFYMTRGPIIEMLRATITTAVHNNTTEFYHLIIALFAMSGVIFLYLIMYLLTKRTSHAVFSAVLLLLLPRFYGDIFTNSKDIAPLYLLLGAIYFCLLLLSGRKKWYISLSLGVLLGAAASTRIILLYVFPVFAYFALTQAFLAKKKQLRQTLLQQIFIGLVALTSLYLFQPFLLTHPVTGIFSMFAASKNFPQIMQILFMGKVYYSNMLHWYYLPVYMLITTPLITLLLFLFGNVLIILKKRTITNIFLLLLFWIPFLVTTFSHVVLYDAWRQLLFLYAPMSIIAVIGFWQTTELLKNKLRYVFWGFCVIGFLLPLFHMVRLHPYEYAYFNELVGGTRGAYQKYEIDYWGESFKEATEWINSHQKQFASKDGNTYVKPCVHMLAENYVGSHVKIDDGQATLYYCINRPILPNPGFFHIVHIVEREGVPINIIEKK